MPVVTVLLSDRVFDDPVALKASPLMPLLVFLKIRDVVILSSLIKSRGKHESKHMSEQVGVWVCLSLSLSVSLSVFR
jgi:hypothetical protein